MMTSIKLKFYIIQYFLLKNFRYYENDLLTVDKNIIIKPANIGIL